MSGEFKDYYCWGCGRDYLESGYEEEDLTYWDFEGEEEVPLCPNCVDQLVAEGRLSLG